jgi:hypothetical protein
MPKKLVVTQNYALARQRSYPPVGDALDAIMKALAAVEEKTGTPMPEETKAWVDACKAVKRRIVKPKT